MYEKLKKDIDNIVWYIPFKKLRNLLRDILIKHFCDEYYDKIVPIGHYESPYPPQDEINDGLKKIENNTSFMHNINAINMNDDVQLEFYDKISKFFDQFDFPKEKNDKYRYYYNNGWYIINCASYLCSIINYIKPK